MITGVSAKDELAAIDREIKRLEERRRELYRLSVEAPESEKLCENHLAALLAEPALFKEIEYPLAIHGISFTNSNIVEQGYRRSPSRLVRIRPCDKHFEGKTFLGLYIGDLARTVGCSLNSATSVLDVYLSRHNPAIWVPSLERIVFGFESWWGAIDSEEQLRAITDESIDGVWYVQALRAQMKGTRVEGRSQSP